MIDMIRRQRELIEVTRTPFAALEGIPQAQAQLQAAFLPSLAFAKNMDAAILQIRDITRMDDMRRLRASLADAVGQMRSIQPAIELKGLLGGTLDLSALAEQMRLQEVVTQHSLTGLLGRVVQELESRDAGGEDDSTVDLADLVEVSAQELAKLPPTAFTRQDVASFLLALFQVVFALWLSQGTDQEIAALRGEVTQGIARLEVGQDSTVALAKALASASLASGIFHGTLTTTHRLTRALHLRLGPDAEATSVGIYMRDTPIQMLRLSEGWAWVAVWDPDADGVVIGWMYARYLKDDS